MKDYFGYAGKICVVTGSSSGMGKVTTEILVDLGAEVYALDVNECPVEGIKKFIKTDVGNKESIDNAFKELPERIDKYFGIAGVSGKNHDTISTFTINLVGNKYITDEYLTKRLADGPEGAIVYVSSIAGAGWMGYIEEFKDICETAGWDETVELAKKRMGEAEPEEAYNFSKRAINYYAMSMLDAFGERNVRLNVIGPGLTKTALYEDFCEVGGGEEMATELLWGPMKRSAEAKDQALATVFLNSDMAPYVSGQILYVDGGWRGQIDAGIIEFDVMDGSHFSPED